MCMSRLQDIDPHFIDPKDFEVGMNKSDELILHFDFKQYRGYIEREKYELGTINLNYPSRQYHAQLRRQ